MAYGYMGNSPAAATANGGGATILDIYSPALIRGIIKVCECYISGLVIGAGWKFKVFRDDGTNYVFLGEITFTSITGLNTVPFWLPIEKGDLIATYTPTGAKSTPDLTSQATGSVYQTADVTTTQAKTSWASLDYRFAQRGTIFSRVQPFST